MNLVMGRTDRIYPPGLMEKNLLAIVDTTDVGSGVTGNLHTMKILMLLQF
jgi:hypothetical protein